MTLITRGMTDRDVNEIVVEALVGHRVTWCRARFLHALVTAGEQGILSEVLGELLPDSEDVLARLRAALVEAGWYEAAHPWGAPWRPDDVAPPLPPAAPSRLRGEELERLTDSDRGPLPADKPRKRRR